MACLTYFNPRTREGCDRGHAVFPAHTLLNFNPRTREGCDHPKKGTALKDLIFQSTHP